ncbi:MAG: hypothetical protein R3C13_01110 [Hyphomonas sp.]|uniref:hypothetical protein n=1 Tax=Hyphomonas sp. TaxID=87 RepID=UPI0035275799
MSDESGSGRDKTGRFVKKTAEQVHNLHTPGTDGIHPLARILFGWTHHKGIANMIFWVLAVLSVVIIAADLMVPRHDHMNFANATGFYGIYGFICFSFAVIMGWPLGRLLRRDENYYGDAGGPPQGIDPEAPLPSEDGPTYPAEGDA